MKGNGGGGRDEWGEEEWSRGGGGGAKREEKERERRRRGLEDTGTQFRQGRRAGPCQDTGPKEVRRQVGICA